MPLGTVVCIGRNSIDKYFRSKNPFVIGEKVLLEPLGSFYGGIIPNAAMILSALGVDTKLFDTIGEDTCSEALVQDLESTGIDTRFMRIDGSYSLPRNYIILTDGSDTPRSTIFIKDEPRRPYALSDEATACLETSQYVYSTTRDLESLVDFNPEAFFNSHACSLVLDVEDIELISFHKDTAYLFLADIIFLNNSGYSKMTREFGIDFFKELLTSRPNKLVVHTKGCSGCCVYYQGSVTEIPGKAVATIDSTGAGDTFNAVMLSYLLKGYTPEESAGIANEAAASSTTILGPRGYLSILKQ
jgi:ribokinase